MAKTSMKINIVNRNFLQENTAVAESVDVTCIFEKIWYLPCLLP